MANGGGDFIASRAFHIHEIGSGALHPVLLVCPRLLFWRGMKETLSERRVLGEAPPESLINISVVIPNVEGNTTKS